MYTFLFVLSLTWDVEFIDHYAMTRLTIIKRLFANSIKCFTRKHVTMDNFYLLPSACCCHDLMHINHEGLRNRVSDQSARVAFTCFSWNIFSANRLIKFIESNWGSSIRIWNLIGMKWQWLTASHNAIIIKFTFP